MANAAKLVALALAIAANAPAQDFGGSFDLGGSFDQGAGSQTPTFLANAVTYDGSTDFLERGANLTGIADSKVGTLSVWLKPSAASDGNTVAILYSDNTLIFRMFKASDDTIHIQAGDGAAIKMEFDTTTTFTSAGGQKHLLISWDLSAAVVQCYINDVSETPAGLTDVNANCTYSAIGDWGVGATPAGGIKLAACEAELYWNPAARLDLSVTANRRLFRSAAGHPVSLAPDGSMPTGSAPVLYLKGDFNNPQVNSGTGGNFTKNGTFTSCTAP